MTKVFKIDCSYVEDLGHSYGKMPSSQQLLVIADSSEHALALVHEHMIEMSTHYESIDIREMKTLNFSAVLGIESFIVGRERERNNGLLMSDHCKADEHTRCYKRLGPVGWKMKTGHDYDCECPCHTTEGKT